MDKMSRLKFLFLDERNIYQMSGTRIVVNQPTRHPENPLLCSEKGFWNTSEGEIGQLVSVMRDTEDGLFKAWYYFGAFQDFAPKPIKEWSHLGYATSRDGIHWEKPIVGQVEWQGSRQNNILNVPSPWVVIFKDPSEALADRRFKMAFTATSDATAAGIFCPICIAYSPDGIQWTVPRLNYSYTPEAAINRPTNPVIPDGTDAVDAYSWYWDPYIRRYVGLMRPVWNVPRRICRAESDDFIHWTPRQIVLEPDDQDPPHHREFHGMHVMRYEDYWIGFLQVYHTLHEGWYSHHEIPQDAPPWTETFSLQLTYSRDGRKWLRCGNRQTFMSPAGGDAFDASLVIGVHQPFIHDDKIWIYYNGCPSRHVHWELRRIGQRRAAGLAQLRLDGFVSVDAEKEGTLITGRLDMIPTYIKLNAVAKAGSIRVEAINPYGEPIPDFSVDQAVPFRGDELEGAIRWKHGRRLSDITDQLLSSGFRLKFYMDRAKLYSFSLFREET